MLSAAVPTYKMDLIRLDRYIGTYMITVMASEILTFLFVIYFMYKEGKAIKALGKQYIKVRRLMEIFFSWLTVE